MEAARKNSRTNKKPQNEQKARAPKRKIVQDANTAHGPCGPEKTANKKTCPWGPKKKPVHGDQIKTKMIKDAETAHGPWGLNKRKDANTAHGPWGLNKKDKL